MLNSLPTDYHSKTKIKSVAQLERTLAQHFQTINLSIDLCKDKKDIVVQNISLRSMSLSFIHWNDELALSADLENSYLILLPEVGSICVKIGEKSIILEQNKAAILSASDHINLQFSSDCRSWLISISRQALEKTVGELTKRRVTNPVVFDRNMTMSTGESKSWWRSTKFLFSEMIDNQTIFSVATQVGDFEHLLIRSILLDQPNNYSDSIAIVADENCPFYLKNSEQFIRIHAQEDINIDDIVEASGTQYRTLYNAFKEIHGVSPMNYLRKVRMEGVRQELLTSCADQQVAPIAMKWAFLHLGRFSVEYKKLFGESPSETLLRE
jgi:AraC-like DNA-binding protein